MVATKAHAFDGAIQSLLVDGRAQAFKHEVRGKEVLDTQSGNDGLFKAAKLSCRETTPLRALPCRGLSQADQVPGQWATRERAVES